MLVSCVCVCAPVFCWSPGPAAMRLMGKGRHVGWDRRNCGRRTNYLFVWSKDELVLRLERGCERFRALHSKCVSAGCGGDGRTVTGRGCGGSDKDGKEREREREGWSVELVCVCVCVCQLSERWSSMEE